MQFACRRLIDDGVEGVLATVITDDVDSMVSKIARIGRLCESDEVIGRVVAGIHIEGPFLSNLPGFIGAHPAEFARLADPEIAKRLIDAGGGRVKLVTLAPECDPGCQTTRFLADQGIAVAAGHCNPTIDQISSCLDQGLTMVTHFGNGCPVKMDRHDNVLQRFLSLRERLWFTFIPDGAHIPFFALKNYLDFVGIDRAIMVSDAISAATLGPGLHAISGMKVQVDEFGVARKPGQKNLAGSTITMAKIQENLSRYLNLSPADIEQLIDKNPRRVLQPTKGDTQ